MKIGFYETRPEEQSYLSKHLSDHQLFFSAEILTFDNLIETDFDIISTHTGSKITAKMIDKLPNLKLIATRTTGFDHIDLAAAKSRQIVVTNVPTYGERTVAEYTIALIFALSRKLKLTMQQVATENYQTTNLQGFDLDGKTLGVIGTGHIGQQVIKMATGLSMKVLAYDAFPNLEVASQLKFNYLPLEQLLQQSDIITLHVPGNKDTTHLINTANISQIKKAAILINTARGPVVETQAILTALDQGILQAAALDVVEDDSQRPALAANSNIIITPHNAFNTIEAQDRISQTTVININNYLNNQPTNLVE